MEQDTPLAAGIRTSAAGGLDRYDGPCKVFFTDRHILAHILKAVVPELAGYGTDYIAERCIEGTPEYRAEPVMRGQSGGAVHGEHTTDATVTEGTVSYDVRFRAVLPAAGGGREPAVIIVNVEAQGDFHPGYPIVTRGIYYGARLLSAQKGTEFAGDDYGRIKKVYSVWVCLNPPRGRRNTLNTYDIAERCHIGSTHEKRGHYDLMTVAMLCLGERGGKDAVGVLGMLDVLFGSGLSGGERCRILGEEYGIPMKETLKAEVGKMCTYENIFMARGIERGVEQGMERGMERGMAQGIERGMAQGMARGMADGIRGLMRNKRVSADEAMEWLGIRPEERPKYAALLAAGQASGESPRTHA